jgi:hypothetical protein
MILLNPENLRELYTDRLNTAWASLGKDIERWQNIVPEETIIAQHVNEFAKFRRNAYEALLKNNISVAGAAAGSAGEIDVEDFRAIVIGVLTAHWTLLRQVAAQRVEGSPYRSSLEELDELAVEYYHRLRDALPGDIRQNVYQGAPIVHLGQIGMLTVFNQNVPLVLSIPYNAIDGNKNAQKSQYAIPHEAGHAILIQVPEILEELRERLSFNEQASTQRQQILSHMIVGWLEEILADMIGTALAGDNFVVSAIWITATSESHVGQADDIHPPTVIRPFIHLKVLEFLDQYEGSNKRAAQIGAIKDRYTASLQDLRHSYVKQTVGDRLSRQFKSFPGLSFITLEQVKQELLKTIEYLLEEETRLESLKGESIGNLLVKCTQPLSGPPNNQHDKWGDIPKEELDQYALPIPVDLSPEFNTPLTVSKGFCDLLPFLPMCRR